MRLFNSDILIWFQLKKFLLMLKLQLAKFISYYSFGQLFFSL